MPGSAKGVEYIHVRLAGDDIWIKEAIVKLKASDTQHFQGRSESYIGKTLIRQALEQINITPKNKRRRKKLR